MSLVAFGRTLRTHNTDKSVTNSLELALSDFRSVLTGDERMQLQQIKEVPDASAALVFTAKLDASNSARRGRSIGTRAYSMLQSVQQFSEIVGTFVSSHPDVAALVWGSIKLTILVNNPSRLTLGEPGVSAEPNTTSRLQPISPHTSSPLLICL